MTTQPSEPLSWLHAFSPYSALHVATLGVIVVVVTALVAARRHRVDPRAHRMDRAVGVLGLVVYAVVQAFELFGPWFDPRRSLPLHFCDVVVLTAALALLTDWRPLRAVTYFWGIGFSSIALFLPDLTDGPAAAPFWLFWVPHAYAVGAPVYDLLGRGYRPGWGDYRVAALWAGVPYLAVALSANAWVAGNYGYLGQHDGGPRPNPAAVVGPWPWRVPAMIVLGAGVLAILVLPWRGGPSGRLATSPSPAVPPPAGRSSARSRSR